MQSHNDHEMEGMENLFALCFILFVIYDFVMLISTVYTEDKLSHRHFNIQSI